MKIHFSTGSKTVGFANFAEFAAAVNTPLFNGPLRQESPSETLGNNEQEPCFSSPGSFSKVNSATNTETTVKATEETKTTKKKRTRRTKKTKKGQNNCASKKDIIGDGGSFPPLESTKITKTVEKVTNVTYSDAVIGLLKDLASKESSKEIVTFGAKSFAEVAGLVLQKKKQITQVHKNVEPEINKVEVVIPVSVSSESEAQTKTKATRKKRQNNRANKKKEEKGYQAEPSVSNITTDSELLTEETEGKAASEIHKPLIQPLDADAVFLQSLMISKIAPHTNVDTRTATNTTTKGDSQKSEYGTYRYESGCLLQLNGFSSTSNEKTVEEPLPSIGLSANTPITETEETRCCTLILFYDRAPIIPGFPRKRGTIPLMKDDSPVEPPKLVEDVNTLAPSTKRWVPRSKTKKEMKWAPDGTILLESEDIDRRVNSALNKLTLEMFDPITHDLLNICRQSLWEEDAKTLKQVISLTFLKACDEPFWSLVYAQFFSKLLKQVPKEIKDTNTLNSKGEYISGSILARTLLLRTCQAEYQKGWTDKIPTNQDGSPKDAEMMTDEYYSNTAVKRRGLGLIKFIGNLHNLGILNDQVIWHCLKDQSKYTNHPSEGSVESLSELLKTVGPKFEASKRHCAALNLVYLNIQKILTNCTLTSRIRFLLTDLQDLRRNQWKPMKACPKTIKEIHNEAGCKKSRHPLAKPRTAIAPL